MGGRSPDSVGRMRKAPIQEKSLHHHFLSQVHDSSPSSRLSPSSTRFHRNVVSWLQQHRSPRDIVTSVTRPHPAKLPRIHGRSVVFRGSISGTNYVSDTWVSSSDFRAILIPVSIPCGSIQSSWCLLTFPSFRRPYFTQGMPVAAALPCFLHLVAVSPSLSWQLLNNPPCSASRAPAQPG